MVFSCSSVLRWASSRCSTACTLSCAGAVVSCKPLAQWFSSSAGKVWSHLPPEVKKEREEADQLEAAAGANAPSESAGALPSSSATPVETAEALKRLFPPNPNPMYPDLNFLPPDAIKAPKGVKYSILRGMSSEHAWFRGLLHQIEVLSKSYPCMEGRSEEIMTYAKQEYQLLFFRHNPGFQSGPMEDRLRTQVQLVCLAIATHRILMAEIFNEELVMKQIHDALGGLLLPWLLNSHKIITAVRRWLLAQDGYTQAVSFSKVAVQDMAAGCSCSLDQGQDVAELHIDRCMFYDILSREGAPQLLPEFCCQQSMRFMQVYNQYNATVVLDTSRPAGDATCCIYMARGKNQRRPSQGSETDAQQEASTTGVAETPKQE